MRYADRMNQLGTETAFEVLAKARALEAQGRSIVHLEIGEPDFNTPAPIRAAAARTSTQTNLFVCVFHYLNVSAIERRI